VIKIPLPSPKNNEDKDTFISRCVKWMDENREFAGTSNVDAKRKAVCYDLWDNR